MRSLLFFLFGSVLLLSGCDRPEVLPGDYGTILEALPVLKGTDAPFPFPMEGENDHQNCEFKESDFM